jgi:hypothetical protein
MLGFASGSFEERLDRDLRQLLRKAKTLPLAELPESTWARVTGAVRELEGKILEAPLSGRRCVYYAVRVDSVVAPSRANTLMRHRDAVPFIIEDRGARAVVDPTNARISAEIDYGGQSALYDANERQRALLASRRALERYTHGTTGLLYYESIIEAGEQVMVLGAGTREPDPEAAPSAYRDMMPSRIQLAGSQRYPLVICDRPQRL